VSTSENSEANVRWDLPPEPGKRTVSFFEFWPAWVMYGPVLWQWLWLSLKHRSLTLPLIANPNLTMAGLVGARKSELMTQAHGHCANAILPWVSAVINEQAAALQAEQLALKAAALAIHFPMVCKPDIGCRGSGVKLVKSLAQLTEALAAYPIGASVLCQKLASYEPEVGIFFVKRPGQNGQITSLTFKFSPAVTGDGTHTLAQLIARDPRAGQLQHLYRSRWVARWDSVIPSGERIKLVFSASHCQGAVFRDAHAHITPELSARVNTILADLPDFNYGRMDVKFADVQALRAGIGLEIVEINGASAESIHIWDRNAHFFSALRTLQWQYRTLFEIGAYQRTKGRHPPGLRALYRSWQLERRLTAHYPSTD
jgi:hypothetical protein